MDETGLFSILQNYHTSQENSILAYAFPRPPWGEDFNRFNALSSVAYYRDWHIGMLDQYWMDRKVNGRMNELATRICPIMYT